MPHYQPHERRLFQPVAAYVSDGLTIAAIKEKLKKDFDLDEDDNQIYRAVYHAVRAGLLRYVPKTDADLARKVASLNSHAAVEVTVVDETVAFCAQHAFNVISAQVLHSLVAELAHELRDKTIRVANGGGPTVAAAIMELPKIMLESHRTLRMESIALSQVGYPKQFNRTSTYLAVRLAEIYGGEAYARLIGNLQDRDFDEKIGQTQLFIGGVGAPSRGYWVESKAKELPATFIGDLFYMPLRRASSGHRKLEPERELEEDVSRLNIRPTFVELATALARGSYVLLFISDDQTCGKASFVKLLIEDRLASHIVLGSRLATAVLK